MPSKGAAGMESIEWLQNRLHHVFRLRYAVGNFDVGDDPPVKLSEANAVYGPRTKDLATSPVCRQSTVVRSSA